MENKSNYISISKDEYKKRKENIEITYGFGLSPFGKTMIATSSKGVCSLEFYDNSFEDIFSRLKNSWQNDKFIQDDNKAQELLDKIFIKKEKVNLFVKGTTFQINVWKSILNIKSGTTCTYSELAQIIGKPKAVRAVATAIASNHVGFLIPCHRIISKNASMAGYRWGINRKRTILSYEKAKI